MKVPKEMIRMDKKCLSLGAKATNDLALLVKSRYMVESRPGDFGVYYLIRSCNFNCACRTCVCTTITKAKNARWLVSMLVTVVYIH